MPPVVDRELRVASRRRWTYWGRTAAGAVAIAVMGWILGVERRTTGAAFGGSLFAGAAFFAWAYAWLAGAGSSASALSSERREGTLGLLFLTDLRASDILLGKLVATSLGAVYCAAAMLPIMAIAILLGGVSLDEYLRMTLAVAVTMGCSLGVGLWASTFGEKSMRSSGLAILGMVLLSGLVPLIGGLLRYLGVEQLGISASEMTDWYRDWFSWASPVITYSSAFDWGFSSSARRMYWNSIGFTGVAGILAVIWAQSRLRRIAFDSGATETKQGWVAWLESWRWPTRSARDAWRRRLLDRGVMVWLSGRLWIRSGLLWALIASGVFFWWLLRLILGMDNDGPFVWLVVSFVLHALFKMSVASEAPRQFHDDRRSGAMELLMTTPVEPVEMVRGRMRALIRRYAVPLMVLMLLDTGFLVWMTQNRNGVNEREFFWMGWMRLLTLVLDCGALAWTGMWVGVSSRGNWTTVPTWLRVMAPPYLLGMVLIITSTRSGDSVPSIFYGCGVLCSLHWIFWPRQSLLREFRERATGSR
jgi:ABC-type transport system involved in cytochrome c biogenesis permease component